MKRVIMMALCCGLFAQLCHAQSPAEHATNIESNHNSIAELQKQIAELEEKTNKLSVQILLCHSDDTVDLAEMERLVGKLSETVKAAFELQTQLQLAQLAEAETKIAKSRRRVQARRGLGEQIVAIRIKSILDVPKPFRTPETLISEWERVLQAKDYEAYVQLLTDDGAELFAGMMMQSMSMMRTMLGLMEATQQPMDDSQQIRSIVETMNRFMRPNPPPEAVAAMSTLSSMTPPFLVTLGATRPDGQPLQPPKFSAEEYMTLLRKSSGMLTDTRQFSSVMLSAASAMEDESTPKLNVDSDWSIKIVGTEAVATQKARPIHLTVCATDTIKLKVENGRWKISLFASESDLMKFAAGPSLNPTSSSSPPAPVLPPAGPSAAYPPSPYPMDMPQASSPSFDGPSSPIQLAPPQPTRNWSDFLDEVPETGTAMVMFNDGSENSKRMLPVAQAVAESANVSLIELEQSAWSRIIAPPATHFVLMKDRQVVGTRTGLLTESRLAAFVDTAADWLTPHCSGTDPSSLVRFDCYINPGKDNIGSQQGGVYVLTGVVVAQHADETLVMGPDSIAQYMDDGYACLIASRDDTGKRTHYPFDVLSSGPVEVVESGGKVDCKTAIYLVKGLPKLPVVRLAPTEKEISAGDRVLTGSCNVEPHLPPLRYHTPKTFWQSQVVVSVGQNRYGAINGPNCLEIECPTTPAPIGYTFNGQGELIGSYALGVPSEKDRTFTAFLPNTTRSVIASAIPKLDNKALQNAIQTTLGNP
ncbi:hypothetical protein [Stieleria varia]|uniref:Uncharacterized protein n=1 Tax=Stieleria varia TaxID=2528005 RepID=A0A5C6AQN8_9BACT|nr:hypothetical protein [Stieleria varia]TWU01292.1 hypothetical protein Pla52n_46660 [Stieleria varia]